MQYSDLLELLTDVEIIDVGEADCAYLAYYQWTGVVKLWFWLQVFETKTEGQICTLIKVAFNWKLLAVLLEYLLGAENWGTH